MKHKVKGCFAYGHKGKVNKRGVDYQGDRKKRYGEKGKRTWWGKKYFDGTIRSEKARSEGGRPR